MRATIFGVMVCILDRLLRRESSVSALARVLTGRDLNADGGQKPNAYMVSFEAYGTQSETFELYTPELSVARSRVLGYFQDVAANAAAQGAEVVTVFEWERDGWVCEFPDRGERLGIGRGRTNSCVSGPQVQLVASARSPGAANRCS